jgi:hypothetical protein
MTRLGPPKGRGPRSEKKMRVAGERSLNRSDTWRASPTSHSSPSLSNPTRPETLLGGTALTAVPSADLAGEIPHAVPALSCPDLQDLITRFGGYNKIPAEAWKQFDRNIAAYRRQLRARAVTGISKLTASDPFKLYPASEECCLCYQRGAFGYRKQTLARFGRLALLSESTCADDLIWFCHQHKPANDFADARRGTP